MTKDEEQKNQEAGTRSGGNTQTKGPARKQDAVAPEAGTRSGGNTQTKGASRHENLGETTTPNDVTKD